MIQNRDAKTDNWTTPAAVWNVNILLFDLSYALVAWILRQKASILLSQLLWYTHAVSPSQENNFSRHFSVSQKSWTAPVFIHRSKEVVFAVVLDKTWFNCLTFAVKELHWHSL